MNSILTIVICTLKKDFVYHSDFPVIVVSPYHGQETDKIKYVKDYGIGMAYARNEALRHINSDYVCYIGDDNILSDSQIIKAIRYMEDHKYAGVSFLTRLASPLTYLQYCANLRYHKRFKAGPSKVIGTPFLFKAYIVKKYRFDNECEYCDDTDLSERMRADGLKVAYSDCVCYEHPERSSFKEIVNRYVMYGKSDKAFYDKYAWSWSFIRRVQSCLHPLIAEFIFNPIYWPFYALIVFLRYYGWLR